MQTVAARVSIATAAEASTAPNILQPNHDVLNLRKFAMEHPTVTTNRTK